MSRHILKLAESTLLVELRRFREFQTFTIPGGRVRLVLEFILKISRALGRPAGRTHIAKFYSYGQPSVAIKFMNFHQTHKFEQPIRDRPLDVVLGSKFDEKHHFENASKYDLIYIYIYMYMYIYTYI